MCSNMKWVYWKYFAINIVIENRVSDLKINLSSCLNLAKRRLLLQLPVIFLNEEKLDYCQLIAQRKFFALSCYYCPYYPCFAWLLLLPKICLASHFQLQMLIYVSLGFLCVHLWSKAPVYCWNFEMLHCKLHIKSMIIYIAVSYTHLTLPTILLV